MGHTVEDNGLTLRSHQLPISPELGVRSWTLPSACWSVDQLDIVQGLCLILTAKALLYPEEIISEQYSLASGFYTSMPNNWAMGREKVTRECSATDEAFIPHFQKRTSQKKVTNLFFFFFLPCLIYFIQHNIFYGFYAVNDLVFLFLKSDQYSD